MTINEQFNQIISQAVKDLDLGKDSKLVVMKAVRDTIQVCLDNFKPANPQMKGGES